MQVALPRAQDAGKQQEHMSKQNERYQESLAQNQVKMEERKRTQVNKFDALTKSAIRDEDTEENRQSAADDDCLFSSVSSSRMADFVNASNLFTCVLFLSSILT